MNAFWIKLTSYLFQQSTIKSFNPLQYLFSDVWQSHVLSNKNPKYYLLFVDHFTRYSWIFPLSAKSEVKTIFLQFKPLVETHFKTKIQHLYTDNGGEYLAMRSYLSTNGISHLTTPAHTPEHNGLSERKNTHCGNWFVVNVHCKDAVNFVARSIYHCCFSDQLHDNSSPW